MPKQNWDRIKQQYFESQIEEVREFLKVGTGLGSTWVVSSTTIDKQTSGWGIEKKEYKKVEFL